MQKEGRKRGEKYDRNEKRKEEEGEERIERYSSRDVGKRRKREA